MADDDQRRRERDAPATPPGEQPVADVAGHCAPDPRPPGAPATGSRPVRRARRRAPPRRARPPPAAWTSARATAARGGRRRSGRPARPARRCAPRRRPAGRGRRRCTSRPWLTPRWTSPDDPAGEREVEEQRPVVGRDGGGQRQVDAEAAGHDRPPPGTADGGQHRRWPPLPPAPGRRPRGRRRGTGPRPAARRDGERRGGAHEARPRPHGPAHAATPDSDGTVAHGSDQQVGVAHGDGELPGCASARRRRA